MSQTEKQTLYGLSASDWSTPRQADLEAELLMVLANQEVLGGGFAPKQARYVHSCGEAEVREFTDTWVEKLTARRDEYSEILSLEVRKQNPRASTSASFRRIVILRNCATKRLEEIALIDRAYLGANELATDARWHVQCTHIVADHFNGQ